MIDLYIQLSPLFKNKLTLYDKWNSSQCVVNSELTCCCVCFRCTWIRSTTHVSVYQCVNHWSVADDSVAVCCWSIKWDIQSVFRQQLSKHLNVNGQQMNDTYILSHSLSNIVTTAMPCHTMTRVCVCVCVNECVCVDCHVLIVLSNNLLCITALIN